MDEYIKRNEAINALRRRLSPNTSPAQKNMLRLAAIEIRGTPVADVALVRHGRWIPTHEEFSNCSLCKYPVYRAYGETPYCPNCGAKMEKGRRNE